MKRSWIGAGMLLALLLGGIVSSWWMQKALGGISLTISQAQHQAAGENWSQVELLTREAQEAWEKTWRISASLTDHAPMELVDSLFSQLEVYEQLQDSPACRDLCAQLYQELEAIADEHTFTWWNFL